MAYDGESNISYLKRAKNKVSSSYSSKNGGFFLEQYNYILYIGKNHLEGGIIEEKCGKYCKREIQTTVIK